MAMKKGTKIWCLLTIMSSKPQRQRGLICGRGCRGCRRRRCCRAASREGNTTSQESRCDTWQKVGRVINRRQRQARFIVFVGFVFAVDLGVGGNFSSGGSGRQSEGGEQKKCKFGHVELAI